MSSCPIPCASDPIHWYSEPMLPIHPALLCTLVLIAIAPLARAQPEADQGLVQTQTAAQTDEQTVRSLVEQLDDDDWLQRDLATIELGELDPGISLEMIERQLGDQGLSPEQRTRLQIAALRRFASRPKGALGVSFGTIRVGAIEVDPIDNENFPASKVLKPGDQIAMVADRVIDGSFSLQVEILSRNPGDTLPATVLRGDRVLHLDLVLGSFGDLTGAVRMDSNLLRNALAARWARMGRSIDATKSAGESLDLDNWSQAAFPEGQRPDPREPSLQAPRGWISNDNVRIETGNSGWSSAAFDVWSNPKDIRDAAQQRGLILAGEQIQPLVALRLLLERERDQIRQDLSDTQGEQRDALQSQLGTLAARIDAVSQRIERTRPDVIDP